MKNLKAFLIFVVIVMVLLTAFVWFTIHQNGKEILAIALRSAFNRDVLVGQVSYAFPFGLEARDIVVKDVSQAKRVHVQCQWAALLLGKVRFSSVEIDQPIIQIHQQMEVSKESGDTKAEAVVSHVPSINKERPSSTSKPSEVTIEKVSIRSGRIDYQDQRMAFALDQVDARFKNIVLPWKANQTQFDFKAQLISQGTPLNEDMVEGKGWFDIYQKNMQANVVILDKAGAMVKAKVTALNNDMVVEGTFKVTDLLKGFTQDKVSEVDSVNNLVLTALSSMGMDIDGQFLLKTKMDDFEMANLSFSGNVRTDSLPPSGAQNN
jgi:hypothetical protein